MSGSTDSQEAADFPLASDSDLASGAVKFVGIKPAAVEGATAPAEGYTADLAQIVDAVVPKAVPSSVETLPAGSLVTLTRNADGTYTLGVPAGADSTVPGPPGPTPAITATATGLAAGASPTVTVTGAAESPHLAFGLPAGGQGSKGAQGDTGLPGTTIASGPWSSVVLYDASANSPPIASNGSGYGSTTLLVVATAGTVAADSIGAVNQFDFLIGGGTKWTRVPGGFAPAAANNLTVAGILTLLGTTLSPSDHPAFAWAIRDLLGVVNAYLSKDGLGGYFAGLQLSLSEGTVTLSGPDGTPIASAGNGTATLLAQPTLPGVGFETRTDLPGVSFGVKDPFGFVRPILNENGDLIVPSSTPTDFTDEEIASFNAMVLAIGTSINAHRKMDTQPVMQGGYNAWLSDGQSFAQMIGGTPSFDTTALAGCYMVGTFPVFDVNTDGSVSPRGSVNVLEPLAMNGGNTLEGFIVAAANTYRMKYLDKMGQPLTYSGAPFICNCTGTGGQTIEHLSRTAAPVSPATMNLFNGTLGVYQALHDTVIAAGGTPYIVVVIIDQGQANYVIGNAHTTGDYTPMMSQYIDDRYTYGTLGICQQIKRPLSVMHQVGGYWIQSDAMKVSTGDAQIAVAQQRADTIISQADFNYPSQVNGHPTGNGHRMIGAQDAVAIDDWMRGKNFDYGRGLVCWYRGSTALVGIFPRTAPLKFKLPFIGFTQAAEDQYPAKGFEISDSLGDAGVSSIDIPATATVRLRTARDMTTGMTLYCGTVGAGGGHTFLSDSDASLCPLVYEYTEGVSDPAENIPEMIGQPYSMERFILGFSIAGVPM